MRRLILALAAIAAVATARAADGDVRGLWLFDPQELSADGVMGTVPNRIPESPLRLEAVTTTSRPTPEAVPDAALVTDVPARYLFMDGSWDSLGRYELPRSLRLNASSSRQTANALRVNLGEALGEGNFTVEWFVHSETNVGGWVSGLIAGVSDPTPEKNPLWRHDAYVNGAGNVRTNNTGKTDWLDAPGNGKTLGNSDAWHHLALVYERRPQRFSYYVDYVRKNVVEGLGKAPADLVVDGSAVFQIFGTMGGATQSYFPQAVAAVRVSEGALPRERFMVVNRLPEPKVIAWYRFEGRRGDVTGADGVPVWFPNLANALPAYDAWTRAEYPVRFVAPPRRGIDDGGLVREDLSAVSSRTDETAVNFRLKAGFPPEYMNGSFTAEMIFRPERIDFNVLPLFGQGSGSGRDTGWCAYCCQGEFRVRHYKQDVGSTEQARNPRRLTANEWHHVAVTYDADTRTFRTYVDYDGVSDPWTAPEDRAEIWKTSEHVFELTNQGSFNSSQGGLCGDVDEFRFTRGVLPPDEFLRSCRLPGLLLTITGPRAEPPAVVPPAPASPSPFVGATVATAEVETVRGTYAYRKSGNSRYESGLYGFPVYRSGNKSVSIGLQSDSGRVRRPDDWGAITVCNGMHPLVRFTFWGSNDAGFGYPFKEIEGDDMRIEEVAETGGTRFVKPYLGNTGVRREFTYVLTPEENRVRVDWDCGVPEADRAAESGVSPWMSFEKNAYRDANLTFGGTAYAYRTKEDLVANPGKWVRYASSDVLWNPGAQEDAFAVGFSPSLPGSAEENFRLTGGYSNETYTLMWRTDTSGGKSFRGTFTVDLGVSAVPDGPTPPATGGIDFWAEDATEVARRPTRNLLPNPGFEQGFRYYHDLPGGATYAKVDRDLERYTIVDADSPCGGGKALRTYWKQGYCSGIRTFPVAVETGRTYTFSFYAKAQSSGQSASVSFASACSLGQFQWLKDGSSPESKFALTTDWRRYSRTFVSDGAGLMIQVGGVADILYDGFQLEEGETPTAWTCDPVEGVLETAREDGQLTLSDPLAATYRLRGPAYGSVRLSFRLETPFRETLFERTQTVRFDATGRAAVPLAFDGDTLGEGIFVLRVGYETAGFEPWCDFHRFSRMDPLGTAHATKDVFGTLLPDDRIARAGDLCRKCLDWGFHSTTWGSTSDMQPDRWALRFYQAGDFSNWVRVLSSDKGPWDDYKSWTNVTAELEARLEEAAYNTVRTNDARFTVWAMGNEEESSAWLCGHLQFDEYAKAQLACRRGVKRANPKAWFLPTCGTSGYNPERGRVAIEGYIAAAARQGVFYDAIGVHQYGNIDGGTLGSYEIVTESQYLMSVMARYGYPADTPVLTTECFDISETWLPQWDTASYDNYQAGKPTYDWGNREFVQAASVARIYLSVLHDWPRHRMANVWVSRPFMDHALTPLLMCKVPNTLGRHFDDVTWIGDVRRDADGVRAFVFRRRDGTGVAALWVVDADVEWGTKRGQAVSLALPSDATAYDLMGRRRRLACAGGVSEIRLTPAPLILRAADPEALLSALDGL